MILYFEDGLLGNHLPAPMNQFTLSASNGANFNFDYGKYLQETLGDNITLYTNDIIFLLNAAEFAWNGETFTIYLRNKEDEWVLLKDLTNRELRQGHNIFRLWFAGEFGESLERRFGV